MLRLDAHQKVSSSLAQLIKTQSFLLLTAQIFQMREPTAARGEKKEKKGKNTKEMHDIMILKKRGFGVPLR